MSISEENKSRAGTWTFCIVGLLVIYAMSPPPLIGVLMKVFGAGGPPGWLMSALKVIYLPLDVVTSHWPAAERFYEAYGKLCGIGP